MDRGVAMVAALVLTAVVMGLVKTIEATPTEKLVLVEVSLLASAGKNQILDSAAKVTRALVEVTEGVQGNES